MIPSMRVISSHHLYRLIKISYSFKDLIESHKLEILIRHKILNYSLKKITQVFMNQIQFRKQIT